MKFSIRDLLLVTVIVAILGAWYVDHRKQAAAYKEMYDFWGLAVYERGVLQEVLATEGVDVEFRDHKQKPLVTDENGKTWEFGGSF